MQDIRDEMAWAATLQLIADDILSDEDLSRERVEYASMLQRLAAEALVSADRRFV